MDVSIVILTLNEYEGVKEILPRIQDEWANEILFVDGGSTDGTVEFARESGYQVVQQSKPGRGNAFREGLAKTSGDIIVFFSPDGNEVPEDIPKLVDRVKDGYDMAIASRFASGAETDDATPLHWFGNRLFTVTINSLFGGSLMDAVNGFRAIRRDCMESIDTDADHFDIEVQMTMRALNDGYSICEIPTHEPERIGGEPELSTFIDGMRLMRTILREYHTTKLR
ncbi:glycosyltransferase family 2 protein [Halomicrobium zhouii]|nr:glycosyltransferase family 2 protein [Halomicrobium zhouii]